MTARKALLDAIIAAVAWVSGYGLIKLVWPEPDHNDAAVVSGWLFAAYTSARFALTMAAAVPLAIFGAALFLLAFTMEWPLLGPKMVVEPFSIATFVPILAWGCLAASPLVFDALVRRLQPVREARD